MVQRPQLLSEQPESRLESLGELIGVANAIEAEAVERYALLALSMERRGDAATAAAFHEMHRIELGHVTAVEHWAAAAGLPVPPARSFAWHMPRDIAASWDEAAGSALLTPYRALAIAVTNEERAFTFYAYVAAQSPNAEVAREAESLAAEELSHAARLRVLRRAAYHREHPAGAAPAVDRARDLKELHAIRRQLASNAAALHRTIAQALADGGDSLSADVVATISAQELTVADGVAAVASGSPGPDVLDPQDPARLLRAALHPLERMSELYEDLVGHASEDTMLSAAQTALTAVVRDIAVIGARIEAVESRR